MKSQVEELPRDINGRVFKVLITVEDTVICLIILSHVRELASPRINSSCTQISTSFLTVDCSEHFRNWTTRINEIMEEQALVLRSAKKYKTH